MKEERRNGEGETEENGEDGGKGRNEIREAVYTKCKSVKECSARVINVHVKLRDCVLYSICMFCKGSVFIYYFFMCSVGVLCVLFVLLVFSIPYVFFLYCLCVLFGTLFSPYVRSFFIIY